MTSKTSKAPTGAGGAFGDVFHGQAIDVPNIGRTLTEVQTNFVSRRVRLRPNLARLVATLVLREAA